ncbi:crosslink repair DNA glycosylase YcaQ family protein [Nocardiopsis tropica]|nr:crosslink repair DNA glycosylase YcaQ family protein [Nocardiopsis tropica]
MAARLRARPRGPRTRAAVRRRRARRGAGRPRARLPVRPGDRACRGGPRAHSAGDRPRLRPGRVPRLGRRRAHRPEPAPRPRRPHRHRHGPHGGAVRRRRVERRTAPHPALTRSPGPARQEPPRPLPEPVQRADRTELPDADIVSLSAEHALRALGAGRARDVANHFVRDRYDGLPEALERLVADGRAVRARVEGADPGEPWFVHADVLPLLETVGGEAWGPRTVLLSPFDNLLCDRERTELLWGFRFRTEMYVPKARREFGYYVLPVLHGDRLVGRIAPRFDRRRGVLDLENVYAEPGAAGVRAAGPDAGAAPSPDPASAEEVADAAEGVAGAVADLAGFLGAREVVCSGAVPAPWREALRRVEAAPVP